MTDDRHRQLADAWQTLAQRCAFVNADASKVYRQLVACYTGPGRFYHDLRHVADVLAMLHAHAASVVEFELLALAAWFHDAVYDSRAADNEERSAALANDTLRSLQMSPHHVERVAAVVRMTRDHQVVDRADVGAQLLLDADLGILGAPTEKYNEYARSIRQEYAWVADLDYRAGRRAVLQRFVDRPRIFGTVELAHLETPARANLTREIAELSG